MLKILLNGDEFNKEREERQPPFSEFTGRQSTSAGTAASVLPGVGKSFTSQSSEELSPTQTEPTLKRNQMVKCYGPFLAGDLCERT